jgi:hypothetical protein
MAQGISSVALKGISDGALADIITGELSSHNPANVRDGVRNSFTKLTKILEENRLVGAMITLKFRCRSCVCDKKGGWGWDWPEEQSRPYVVDDFITDGEVVYDLENSAGGGERITVSQLQPWHIRDAVELARKKCEEN